jgi:Na+/melibiose symporter-like transporter
MPLHKAKNVRTVKHELIEEVANSKTMCGMLTVYDACIVGCMLLNFGIASFETLGIHYAEVHFDLLSTEAATIVATCGTIGVLCLLLMGYFSKRFTDIQLTFLGMITLALGRTYCEPNESGGKCG